MTTIQVETYSVQIFMAGDVDEAKKICREFCYNFGLCVTVTPTTYIYTGGEEAGFVVGLLNYPRFPTAPAVLFDTAGRLAEELRTRLFQHSYLLSTLDKTVWSTLRDSGK